MSLNLRKEQKRKEKTRDTKRKSGLRARTVVLLQRLWVHLKSKYLLERLRLLVSLLFGQFDDFISVFVHFSMYNENNLEDFVGVLLEIFGGVKL